MVDLRSTLRPLVDEPARERLPVAELAERATQARRRRLRRRSALAGLVAVAVVAVAGSIIVRDGDPDQVTTVHGPEVTPSTTVPPPSTTSTEPSPGGTEPGPPSTTATPPGTTPPRPTTRDVPIDGPTGTDPALVVTETTTSDWDRGHCVELRVENTGDAPIDWVVELTPDGAIETLWNARIVSEDGPRITFSGEDWNATLAPRAWTTFGTCLATS